MVDVGGKAETKRRAVAQGRVTLSPEAFARVREGMVAKGDVLGVARLAAIMAAKKVDDLIPLTHPLPITGVEVDFQLDEEGCAIHITAAVSITARTGVEMEALTAVSIAALTIYDMCKAVDKGMVISDIMLLEKSGGKSGTYRRED
jgi:cyclic pyranopterin phosphate synthase